MVQTMVGIPEAEMPTPHCTDQQLPLCCDHCHLQSECV